jgi:predicted ATPase
MPADDARIDPDSGATQHIGLSSSRLAQYRLLGPAGAGAMGVVHHAIDLDLDRPVAIKLLHDDLPGGPDPALLERFLREARSAAQLTHPNVALVYQVGREDEQVFIVMEWVDGGDLGQAVKRLGALPWREAAAAARDAAAGLAAAHGVGLVHRDIKPSNLMRNRSGQVKLVDFGLARLHEAASELTTTGNILGTPAYLSPEQCRGDSATPLSDQYSLGCTLYHLLTGRPPFAAPNMAALLQGHLSEPLPDPRPEAPDVPAALLRVLKRATAKRPQDRFPDCARLAQALSAVLEGRPFAVAGGTAPPGNLPQAPNSFVGRDAEMADLVELLQETRLVTLIGPGGTGKTRLALHAARLLADESPGGFAGGFTGGVWLVELATLPAGSPVAGLVAATLGVRELPGQSIEQGLVQHLRRQPTLLLLDNCEHVIDAASALAGLLTASCASLRILASSRQPLACPGELTLAVPPLPTGQEGDSLQALAAVDAVRMFADRARAARADFVLDGHNTAAVVQICRRLDGIPLAIELAAARVKVLSPLQIAERLADVFKLLSGGGQRTLLPRQQTLRALIDWSWDLLDDGERRLLECASVFAGDFSLDAAEAVLPDPALDSGPVLDTLTALVDKSLLGCVDRRGRMRFRLLQTMRQYAAERLQARGAPAAVHRRHAEFFMLTLRDAVARTQQPARAEAMLTLELEHDNALAALDAVVEHRWFDIGLRLASSLGSYWFMQGMLAEGVARLQRLLDASPPAGAELAAMLKPAGHLARHLGRLDLAQSWFERGLQMARDKGQGRLEGALMGDLGSVACARGELRAAQRWFEQSRDLCLQLRERTEAGYAQNNLALVLKDMGRIEEARVQLGAALEAIHSPDATRDSGVGRMSLAELELDSGEYARAAALFQQALDIMITLDDRWNGARARGGLGKAALCLGDWVGAERHLLQSLSVLRRLDDKAAIADLLDHLALLAWRQGQREPARALARESLLLRLTLDNRLALAASLETQAVLRGADGTVADAQADPGQAAKLLGCAAGLRGQIGASLPVWRGQLLGSLRTQLEARLGTAAFEGRCIEGASADALALASASMSASAPARTA